VIPAVNCDSSSKAPRQPIPHGRPYHYHPNSQVHMMTVRKRVGPLPVQQLAVRHFVDHSSSDYFSLDDLIRDSSSYSSSKASSYFHSDASSDSSSRHALSDHSSPDLSSTFTGPSRKRRRVKRITHPVMPKDIPEPGREGAVGVTYEILGDLVQRFHDHTEAIPVHRVQDIKGVKREQGHRIIRVELAVTALTKRVAELERDNRRLRGTASVKSQRVDRLWRGMSRMHREMRQMRRL
nr:hypothetical protein [Tanacetum cinerariifolium]